MKLKPGANRSFIPSNTIDPVNRWSRQQKRTYGSPRRTPLGKGQSHFLDKHLAKSPDLTTANTIPDLSPSPPRKRRKTIQQEVVDLDDDDDISDVQSPPPRNSHSSPSHPMSVTSKSQPSCDSGPTVWGSSTRQQLPISSFKNTDLITNSHRKKSRDGSNTSSKFVHGLLGNQSSPIQLSEDELAKDLNTSYHFPPKSPGPARINPSTYNKSGRDVEDRAANKNDFDNFRHKFKRTNQEANEIVDKLLGKGGETATYKRVRQANNATGRKKAAWPLIHARSNHFSSDGDLALKINSPNSFQLIYADTGAPAAVEPIILNKINDADTDKVAHIRLKGSRLEDGNQLTYDIQFEETDHLQLFCDNYLISAISGKIRPKSEDYMERLFRKPLDLNGKVGSSSVAPDNEVALLTKRVHDRQQTAEQLPSRSGLIQKLTSENPNDAKQESRPGNKIVSMFRSDGPLPLTRPTRPTRSTRITYDAADEEKPAVKEKVPYSQEFGLGKPWDKPLQYGSGRRRALVNFSDLERLDDDIFLNDSLIDFYLIYLFEQAKIPANKVYFFNTHFYTTLTRPVSGEKSAINYAGVARWTAREDIFNYDYIVIPINESAHWYLAIICNVNNIDRKDNIDKSSTSSPPALEHTSNPIPQPSHKRVGDMLALPAPFNSLDEAFVTEDDEDIVVYDKEESKLNLVDAEAVEFDDDAKEPTVEGVSVRESPAEETTRMRELSLAELVPKGVLGETISAPLSAKKKSKQKSGPALRKYDLEAPLIVVLDSLENTHPRAVRVLRDYLLEEGRAKRNIEATIPQRTFYVKANHIPMQENFSDCGVYLLGYAQKFFANPRGFSNRLLSREMDSETDWPDMRASDMRTEMRTIIFSLWSAQHAERKQAKALNKGNRPKLPPVETNLTTAKPGLQSPFQEQPSTKSEARSNSTRQSSPVKVKLSPIKTTRKPSPKVVIYSPTLRSPKRRLSPSVQNHERDNSGATAPFPAAQAPVYEQRHVPKRQKQSRTRAVTSRHTSPEQFNVPSSGLPGRPFEVSKVPQLIRVASSPPQRGSSLAPIAIEDSQDMSSVLPPKKQRQSSIEMVANGSSPIMPRNYHRSTPRSEEDCKPSAADMLFSNSTSHLEGPDPRYYGIYRHPKMEQLVDDDEEQEEKWKEEWKEEWNGFVDDEELTIPESPAHERQSPLKG